MIFFYTDNNNNNSQIKACNTITLKLIKCFNQLLNVFVLRCRIMYVNRNYSIKLWLNFVKLYKLCGVLPKLQSTRNKTFSYQHITTINYNTNYTVLAKVLNQSHQDQTITTLYIPIKKPSCNKNHSNSYNHKLTTMLTVRR